MRVPLGWLRDYVDYDLTPEELAGKLTMAGLSVESIEDLAAPMNGILVGRIVSLVRHPSEDRLLLAGTDWGDGPRTLVTGARNLSQGDLVPVAPPGVRLPDGRPIEARVFAGVASEGMLCSAAELGLEKQSDGILVLEGEWKPGTPVARALGLDEKVLEIELTPNRADCLGLLGVAREVAAITGGRLHIQPARPRGDGPPVGELAKVRVSDPDLCPRYGGKVFVDVRIGPSPDWMRDRLRAAGVRPINNVVDVTNYVMLEMNQPLHAFDLERLSESELIIRRSRAGEKVRTLDGATRDLDGDILVITDPSGPVAIAGIMGGADSEVTEKTRAVFLEGAVFERTSVRRAAKSLGMRTEASLRFERGIDPANTLIALERAAHLIEEIGAGRAARGIIDAAAASWQPGKIATSAERINRLLGTDLSADEIAKLLTRLGFGVESEQERMSVTVPTFRADIENTADLAEEVARLYGYDRLPVTYPPSTAVGMRTPEQEFDRRARELLRSLGQTEVMTYSFTSPRIFDRLLMPADGRSRHALGILSPLSEDWSILRPTLLGGILEALSVNARRGLDDVALFEQARVYLPEHGKELPAEPLHLAGGLMGAAGRRFWGEKPRQLDYFDLKGLVETLLRGLAIEGVSFDRGRHPSMHPGRTARLTAPDGEVLGFLGEAHPRVTAAFDLRDPVFLYEIDLDRLRAFRAAEPHPQAPPRFPSILRDLAVIVPGDLPLADLDRAIRALGGPKLVEVRLFDVYTGHPVKAGWKSMAFTLTFRDPERTLKDEEAASATDGIVNGLRERFGAELR